MSQEPEELGRIIRGDVEEVWSLVSEDGGSAVVRYEVVKVAGDERHVTYMSPAAFSASNAPEPIKDRLVQRGFVPK
ncbi:hypothetical protein PY365_34035 [Roseiarcaceae bacterium H3SJ34-1]|uniref:hypothetical protein n=1 Tax=Terripilifer ovatus TaxID=3032367 RepID=UPI003AB9B0D5|nr:hypothetical protein [Roseiarcaceae bacterium H3SJ34-1]